MPMTKTYFLARLIIQRLTITFNSNWDRLYVQYVPQSAHGSTLITTRNRRVGERFAERDKPIIVLPLESEDAKSMLLSRLPDGLVWTAADVSELLENLQHLPLAIAQAASYISEEGV